MKQVLARVSAVALLAACTDVATVRLGNSVLCGPTEVIMPSQAVTALVRQVGEADYGRAVCASVAGVNAAGVTEPRPVRVTLPTGEVTVRVRGNGR